MGCFGLAVASFATATSKPCEQLAQMRFDAHAGEHPAKNDLADLAFAEL